MKKLLFIFVFLSIISIGSLYLSNFNSVSAAGHTDLIKDVGRIDGVTSIEYHGEVIFPAITLGQDALWKTDGTTEGTVPLANIYFGGIPNSFVIANDLIFFAAHNGVSGVELWKSDGTPGGTGMIKDINVGSSGSFPGSLIEMDDVLYFIAYANDSSQEELWKSDGTSGGTVMVKELNPGGPGCVGGLVNFNDKIYFTGNDGVNGFELWETDGTADGTVMVSDINVGGSGQPQYFYVYDNDLYFNATDGINDGLWRSDGTANGTEMVKAINTHGPSYAGMSGFIEYSGDLLFMADDSIHGFELWKSDGTTSGTQILKDIYKGETGSWPMNFTLLNGRILFSAWDETHGLELWRSDGTVNGTVLVKDIRLDGGSLYFPSSMRVWNNNLYFSANDGNSEYQLWRTNGVKMSTNLAADVEGGNPNNLFVLDDELYFFAYGYGLSKFIPPEVTEPDAPTELYVNQFDTISADLRWTEPNDNYGQITNYKVSVKEGEGEWSTDIDTESTSPIFHLEDLDLGATYSFKVKAVNEAGESDYSDEYTFVKVDPGELENPLNLNVVGDVLNVDITWDAPAHTAGYQIIDYHLEYKDLSGTWDAPLFSEYKRSAETGWSGIVLPEFETTYEFRVSAVVEGEIESEFSEITNYTTPVVNVPETIDDLSVVSVGVNYVDLDWSAPYDNGSSITEYLISYRSNQGEWFELNTQNTNTDFRVDNLVTGTQYEFRVGAVNHGGQGIFSNIVNTTPFGLGAPQNLTVISNSELGELYIDIDWDEPENNGGSPIVDYLVEYRDSEDSWESLVYSQRLGTDSTQQTYVGKLNYGSIYDIRVFAINEDEEVGPSSQVVQYQTPDGDVHYIYDCSASLEDENDGLGLQAINQYGYDDTYRLANDIDCSEEDFTPIEDFSGNSFSGLFDGQNYTIRNISYEGDSEEYVGLFSALNDGARVRNFKVENMEISGLDDSYIGSIAGYASGNILIENVIIDESSLNTYADSVNLGGFIGMYEDDSYGLLRIIDSSLQGNLQGDGLATNLGGLVGEISILYQNFKKGVILDGNTVSADILGNYNVGGLVGSYSDEASEGMDVLNCSFDGEINTDESGNNVGGLIGSVELSTGEYLSEHREVNLFMSHSAGTINGNWNVGGLIGTYSDLYDSKLSVNNCYSEMEVSGGSYLGGLIGSYYSELDNESDFENRIANSYSIGDIIGNEDEYGVGGLVGTVEDGSWGLNKFSVLSSYSSGDISGGESVGGLIGDLFGGKYNIENSYSQADVTGVYSAGGIIGSVYSPYFEDIAIIDNTYSSGAVSVLDGEGIAGGLIGVAGEYTALTNSFKTGLVTSTDDQISGSLIGVLDDGDIYKMENNFFDQVNSGLSNCIGEQNGLSEGCFAVNADGNEDSYFIGNHSNSPLDSWSFVSIWSQVDDGYPVLRQNISTDNVKPLLTLIGENPVSVIQGEEYVDAGVIAVDDQDLDINNNVIVTGSVNNQIIGTYVLTYYVCDTGGNCSSRISRTVEVVPPPPIRVGPTQHSYIDVDRIYTGEIIDEEYGNCEWTNTSETGTIVFGNANSLVTSVKADHLGTYSLVFTCTNLENEEESFSVSTNLVVHTYGDINNDQLVDNSDFTLLMYNWGSNPVNNMADYTQDAQVDNNDFTIMMYWWGDHRPS